MLSSQLCWVILLRPWHHCSQLVWRADLHQHRRRCFWHIHLRRSRIVCRCILIISDWLLHRRWSRSISRRGIGILLSMRMSRGSLLGYRHTIVSWRLVVLLVCVLKRYRMMARTRMTIIRNGIGSLGRVTCARLRRVSTSMATLAVVSVISVSLTVCISRSALCSARSGAISISVAMLVYRVLAMILI